MAHARVLTLGLVLATAGSARAAGPCEEDRGQTGLALAAAASSGLAVAAVDGESAAAAAGLRVGDTVVQANGALAPSCGDYARVVREARREHKAVLLLVRRAAAEVPLALGPSTWERALAAAVPPAPAEAPSVRALVATLPPPPLPPGTHVSVEEVTRGFSALAGGGRLGAYQEDVLRVRRQVETLAGREAAPAAVLGGLRTVLRYYEGAAVAWASEETQRERERRPRHLPAETMTAPFFADSEVAALIDEFPFLRAVVLRDPAPGLVGESGGVWRPREARTLLWEGGREELGRLTGWLAAGNP